MSADEDREDAYEAAMRAAVMPELEALLAEQTRRFQAAAAPFWQDEPDEKEPAYLRAWDCAGARLDDIVRRARKTVLEELEVADKQPRRRQR